MRALVVSIWVFINLVFFGMCGYMYLLWSQYWMFMERQTGTTTSTYDQQIYYYNRGYLPPVTNKTHNATEAKLRIKHSLKDNSTYTLIKNSRPRFPNLQGNDFELDNNKYVCVKNDSNNECLKKTAWFRDKILKELRRVLEDEGNILKTGIENPYNVNFEGTKGDFTNKSRKQIICELKKTKVNTLKRGDIDGFQKLNDFLPKRSLYENRRFNTCAIVASSGALKDSNLGKTIDSHDLVLRFNHAPTKGFEKDVGKKTTIRVLNSQVVTRKMFKFLESDMYKNITIVAWDPSNYRASLDEWLKKPEFNLFPAYIEYKRINEKARIFLVNPQSLWALWDFLQGNSPTRLRRNPLSSGFLGLNILLPICNFVDVFEYIPSARVTKRCHYYDPEDNPACTFGVWHPLAAEKLLTYYINTNNDHTVFQNGFVRIPGFGNYNC